VIESNIFNRLEISHSSLDGSVELDNGDDVCKTDNLTTFCLEAIGVVTKYSQTEGRLFCPAHHLQADAQSDDRNFTT